MYFRYETTKLDFTTGVLQPSYPVRAGLSLHSYPTEKPNYTITTRNYGTTAFSMASEGIKRTDRDTIYGFWNTTLTEGYNTFTIIDPRKRMLFEASWNNWIERWSKENGGIYTIDYNLQSAIPWTPHIFGAYPISENNIDNHTFDTTTNLTAQGGVLVDYATDANILRKNGYSLRVEGAASASGKIGAGATVSLEKNTEYNNLGLFCQFMASDYLTNGGQVRLIQLSRGSNIFSILIDGALSGNDFYGAIINNGTTQIISKGDGVYHRPTKAIWYDCCLTYDAVNQRNELYICPSGTSTFTDFLNGTTNLNEQTAQYGNELLTPVDKKWLGIELIKENGSLAIGAGDFYYLQNIFIFDGFITHYDFNMLRRLCWLWNNKTTTYPK